MNKRAVLFHLIFLGSLLPALMTLVSMGLDQAYYRRYWLPFAVYWVAGHLALVPFTRRSRPPLWVLALAVFHLLILFPELVLRHANFHFQSGIQFGFPRHFEHLERDPDRFWKLPRTMPGTNAFGFRDKEVAEPKPAGVCRILFLGDSVPGQGYPQRSVAMLNRRETAHPVECVNFSLAGYSSHQGLVLAKKYGDFLEPDMVVIQYGWNDHWLAYQAVDAERIVPKDPGPLRQTANRIYEHSRIVQGIRYLLVPLLGADRPLPENRVPLERYAENLKAMASFFSAKGAQVVFITPPSAHQAFGVPDYLVEEQFVTSAETAIAQHAAYNQALRQVAADNAWPVLDLADSWTGPEDLRQWFLADGIHLTEAGLDAMAASVANFLETLGCVP